MLSFRHLFPLLALYDVSERTSLIPNYRVVTKKAQNNTIQAHWCSCWVVWCILSGVCVQEPWMQSYSCNRWGGGTEGPCKPQGRVNRAASPVSINIHMRKPVCPHLIFDLLEVKLHHLILFHYSCIKCLLLLFFITGALILK